MKGIKEKNWKDIVDTHCILDCLVYLGWNEKVKESCQSIYHGKTSKREAGLLTAAGQKTEKKLHLESIS